VPAVGAVGAADADLLAGGVPADPQAGAGADQDGAVLGGRGLTEAARDVAQVGAGRDLVGVALADALDRAADPGQAEHPLLVAVDVAAHDVPAAGVGHHAPRLEGAGGDLAAAAALVVEADPDPVQRG